MMMNLRHCLAGILALGFAASCYTELEDEDQYRNLAVNTRPRIPNQPPQVLDEPPTDGPAPTTPEPGGEGGMTGTVTDETPPGGQTLDDLVSAECQDVPTRIFGAVGKCGSSSCHGSPDQASVYLDLGSSPADAHTRLLDLEGTGPCAGQFIIDTANPEQSLLLTKLDTPAPCGLPMPVGPALTAEETACVVEWTLAAAQLANQ